MRYPLFFFVKLALGFELYDYEYFLVCLDAQVFLYKPEELLVFEVLHF